MSFCLSSPMPFKIYYGCLIVIYIYNNVGFHTLIIEVSLKVSRSSAFDKSSQLFHSKCLWEDNDNLLLGVVYRCLGDLSHTTIFS